MKVKVKKEDRRKVKEVYKGVKREKKERKTDLTPRISFSHSRFFLPTANLEMVVWHETEGEAKKDFAPFHHLGHFFVPLLCQLYLGLNSGPQAFFASFCSTSTCH